MPSTTTSSDNFYYTPDITAIIQSVNGVQDVSADIIDFTMQRQINAVSTFSCTLNNPGMKYNYDGPNTIRTMDRIVVYLKRTTYVQCFTGYITYAPLVTIIPTPITLTANCTLRILQVTYWDDTLISFQNLLLNVMDQAATSSAATYNDGGVAQAVVNVLTQVCGWNTSAIHIQAIPQNFINFTAQVYVDLINSTNIDQNVIADLSKALSAEGVTSGQSVTTGENLSNNQGPDGGIGIQITVNQAQAFTTTQLPGASGPNVPGINSANPVSIDSINKDIYYCSAPWSYLQLKDKKQISNAKTWLATNDVAKNNDGRLLLVSNMSADKVVAVRATSIPEKPNVTEKGQAVYDPSVDYLQLHPGVIAYLNGNLGDPTAWSSSTSDPGSCSIRVTWADQTKVTVGKQPDFSTTSLKNSASVLGSSNGVDITYIDQVISVVINSARSMIGATYPPNDERGNLPANYRENPNYINPSNGKKGLFDCSGLCQWAYATADIAIGYDTTTQCGPEDGSQPEKYGQWISPSTQPQPGDLLFFNFPGDSKKPGHVVLMTVGFGQGDPTVIASENKDTSLLNSIKTKSLGSGAAQTGVGYVIQASQTGVELAESPIYWSDIAGGKEGGYGGGTYVGARRPISLQPQAGINPRSNVSIVTAATTSIDPNNPSQRAPTVLTNDFNNIYQMPQYDMRASVMVGTPRAFLLDNPVMNDITQILGSGLRLYQSAPNGDFVAWFPDYYGIYGTDPVMEISPVEIIDFEIYHDDNQLATHVGIVGDTNGIGQQVSNVDWITTNGVVSIQDTSTMAILFGTFLGQGNNLSDNFTVGQTKPTKQYLNNLQSVATFLNTYGMRPFVQTQQMIHSHAMEYMYALQQFMLQWVNQFVSTVQTTFMPEVYPGMRITINMPNQSGSNDNYEFYVMGVTHQGSRSGGFTTSMNLTAPIKNGTIMHYGLDILP